MYNDKYIRGLSNEQETGVNKGQAHTLFTHYLNHRYTDHRPIFL